MGEAQAGGCYEDRWASEEVAARFNAQWVEVEDRSRQGGAGQVGSQECEGGIGGALQVEPWRR
jgi:hypothetical protein